MPGGPLLLVSSLPAPVYHRLVPWPANGPTGSKVPTPLKLLFDALHGGSVDGSSNRTEGEGSDYNGLRSPQLVPPGAPIGPNSMVCLAANLDLMSFQTMRWKRGSNNPTRRLVPVTDLWLQIAKGVEGVPEAVWEAYLKAQSSGSLASMALTSLAVTDHSTPSPADDSRPAHLEKLKHLPSNGANEWDTQFCYGSLTLPNQTPSIPVFIKIVDERNFKSFVDEVLAYRQLRDLPVAPRLFAAMREPKNTCWALLVLEHAGKPLYRGPWAKIKPRLSKSVKSERCHRPAACSTNIIDRKEIYFALVQIHARGVVHGCPTPGNIFRRPDGTLCFVSFSDALVGHKCEPQTCQELCYLRNALGLPDDITDDRGAGQS
ncbi:hypothetical protein GGX14DRAFT_398816 [Mycena pura]|uniref:Protein kinase domain-containing protein n=1 Tax=Mycena pura TaxID=153505 RepID=A0AAD6V9U0_9AGAR|nr:hypothetical protein GGX14DRAFT_398816 [Mycena pura]